MKVDYDEDNDVLWIHSGKKVSDSLEVDRFVVDFMRDGSVSGVEIMDASKIISNLSTHKVSKEYLGLIEDAKLRLYRSKDLVYIVVSFRILVNNKMENMIIQVPAPRAAMAA
ncbi:Uncharacterised protein [uncultured archaeon]|nr:Uncharacterised protein [uncultured archaeon]